jgi:hypothetical protein
MNKNTAKLGGSLVLGLFLLTTAASARADEAATSAGAGHQIEIAMKCEQKASALQASIDAQAKLKAENLRQWILRKSPMNRDIAAADKRYDNAIAALQATRAAWLELAHSHRLQAMEQAEG